MEHLTNLHTHSVGYSTKRASIKKTKDNTNTWVLLWFFVGTLICYVCGIM